MKTAHEHVQVIEPSEATKAHWNITLKENSNLNLEFFHSLCKQSQIGLASLIYPLHYASIEHNELKRTYEKFIKPYVQN
tara:strand:+ start:112 stop:348 length:237 start_codon:yes stop_codon:yes gene_type:complete